MVNHDVVIYNFRLELVEHLLQSGYEVHVSSPYGERIDFLIKMGVKYHPILMERHGINPLKERILLETYKLLYKKVRPDVVLGYTIKPNIYGAIAAKEMGIPFIANITGLGTAVENKGWKQKVLIVLYRYAFTDVQTVFFQNVENQQFFVDHHIGLNHHRLLPGSGVNLQRFPLQPYPEDTAIRFAFISRIMKEKGIEQYLEAAKWLTDKYDNLEFHICGFCEEAYLRRLEELSQRGVVIYHGMVMDISSFLKNIHCVIHPTYYPEGISNVLLEACASGRPIITTDRSGCREVVDDTVNGYKIPQKDTPSLIAAMERFIHLPNAERKKMGINGRLKVERQFDRKIVVEAYMQELEHLGQEKHY